LGQNKAKPDLQEFQNQHFHRKFFIGFLLVTSFKILSIVGKIRENILFFIPFSKGKEGLLAIETCLE
jgi:hypothetical protein